MKIGKDKIKRFAVCFAVVFALGAPGVWLAAGLALGKVGEIHIEPYP